MDRRYVIGSVAVFTAACASQLPHTAALYAPYWLQEPGPVRPVSLLSYERTVAAWQLPPQNPWAPYAKFTLLTALPSLSTPTLAQLAPGGQGVPVAGGPSAPSAELGASGPGGPSLPSPPSAPGAPGAELGASGSGGPSQPSPQAVVSGQGPPVAPAAPLASAASGTQAELPDVSRLLTVNNALAAAAQVAASGLPDDAMWVVDLRGPAAVAFGSYLSHHAQQPVSVVPTFNNWPASNELIPAEETLAALATMLPQAPPPEAQGTRPVFLLDAWRLAFRSEEIPEDVVDNRYYLTPADLPDAQRLREQGIRHVLYVVELRADVETEEDDLNAIFAAYQQAGIAVHFVDLALLAGRSPAVPWVEVLRQSEFVIVPRRTIIYDSAFYLRARGGFGGLAARPRHYGLGHYGVHHSVSHFGHYGVHHSVHHFGLHFGHRGG